MLNRETAVAIGRGVADGLKQNIGKATYAAYKQKAGGKTHDGKDMPKWEDLGDEVRSRWDFAGQCASLLTMKVLKDVQEAVRNGAIT